MQIPPSQREVKPQQERHPPPGTETHCGGGGEWRHGRGTKDTWEWTGSCQGIFGNSMNLGIAFCGMMKPLGISLVHGAEDTTHGMLDYS